MLEIVQTRIMFIPFDVMSHKQKKNLMKFDFFFFLSLSEREDNLQYQQISLIIPCFETLGFFAKRKVASLKPSNHIRPQGLHTLKCISTHTYTHHTPAFILFYFDKIASCVNFGNSSARNTHKNKMLFKANCKNRSVESSSVFVL